ncbi:MAG: carbohydrate binding domain-containing protein [Eubacterium sp.]|nr:carbohydrate binding domain-containing protein [Eubacterium sp.]
MRKLRTRLVASALSLGLAFSGMPINAYAQEKQTGEISDDYKLVWSDEFDGDSLNTEDWNVEAHNPGWVNEELQRYVSKDDMAENIQVNDGKLQIFPTVEKKKPGSVNTEILNGNTFDSTNWTLGTNGGAGTVSYEDGKAVVNVTASGTENSGVQLQTTGLSLIKGHDYQFKVTASSTIARKTEITFIQPGVWDWYGGTVADIGTTDGEISFNITAKADCDDINLQLNLGLIGGSEADSLPATVTFSNVSVIDLSAETVSENEGGDKEEKFNFRNYDYTSGRINTKGKRDFTYGYFECSARVPEGTGYLPAFWLMASDENNYGQWPQCGEMDIMEVMGQNTKKSYHTIHYGYDPDSGHRENQGTLTLEDGDFSSEYHTYGLEWLPGQIIWYVDGEEVYRTDDWFTGKDEESNLTYPAPFDQDFYVILNLAVGGKWVGYPDEAAVNDMSNQSYDIDYVRVYQLPEEEYKKLEEEAKKPEHVVSYREADANGNYVRNGDFAKSLKQSGSDEENFELYLVNGNEATAKVANNAVTITPAEVGTQNHSIQLKQTGVPIRKDWTYTLSFDAYATEKRSIIIDVEGPDKGWTRYFNDTTVDITKEKKTYTYDFTMTEKSDPNGSLEFNLGNQGSTAAVTISNVSLKVKEAGPAEDVIEKTVRADGNYVYNGSFDQGDKRLGYWEIAEDDKAAVSVTNDNMVRELCVKVEVPEGTTALNPVTLYQSDLAPLVKGTYDLSFDAYMEDGGSADALTVTAAGITFNPEITTERKSYNKQFKLRKDLEREDSDIKIEFTKPGVYYLDNVFLTEAAILKNGFFDSSLSGFQVYANSPAVASGMIDNMGDNDNTFVMSIKDTGAEGADVDKTWYIQLIQDGITLENGKNYELSFDIKSTVNRQVKYGLECNGNLDNPANGAWENYNGSDDAIEITTEWQKVTSSFTMVHNTDTQARFKIAMGDFGEELGEHDVYVDNIVLKEVGSALSPEQPAEIDEENQQAADPVIAAIKALEAVEPEYTDEFKGQLDEVENAYNALTIPQQDMVPDEVYDILYSAKQAYKNLGIVAALEALINEIGDIEATDECLAKIEAAENAYAAMTDEQKEMVSDVELVKLSAARKAYEDAVAKQSVNKDDQENKDNNQNLVNNDQNSGNKSNSQNSNNQNSNDKKDDKKEETKPSNEWKDGKWYNEDGSQSYEATAEWKSDASGWWFEDSSGWYPKNEWQKIDGKWYFFTESGYMDYGEYRDGCWLGDDGAWVEEYSGGHWMSDSKGWWFEDNGWYPVSQYLWIDGVKYWFDASGYTK